MNSINILASYSILVEITTFKYDNIRYRRNAFFHTSTNKLVWWSVWKTHSVTAIWWFMAAFESYPLNMQGLLLNIFNTHSLQHPNTHTQTHTSKHTHTQNFLKCCIKAKTFFWVTNFQLTGWMELIQKSVLFAMERLILNLIRFPWNINISDNKIFWFHGWLPRLGYFK